MLRTTKFNKPLTAGFRGTQGYGTLTGIEFISSHPDTERERVMLLPVTEEGYTLNSKLEIPVSSLPEVIAHLQSFLN